MLEEALGLFDHLMIYFETLLIYSQKLANEKFNRLAIFLVIAVLLLFLNCTGIVFLVYAGFQGLLDVFQQDSLKASLVMGSGLFFIPLILVYLLIKKTNF